MKGKTFNQVHTKKPNRSAHDLSQDKNFDAEFGRLYPIYVCPTIPGDTHNLNIDLLVRASPLIYPVMWECDVTCHAFYTPYRILWDDWEEFITGGVDGDSEIPLPKLPISIDYDDTSLVNYIYGVTPPSNDTDQPNIHDLWLRAYNKIYNDYYRDENLIDEVDLTSLSWQNRAWTKDYFTSALPWQQRGNVQSIPIQVVSANIMPSNNPTIVNTPLNWVGPGAIGGSGFVVSNGSAGIQNSINPPSIPAQSELYTPLTPQAWMQGALNYDIDIQALADITIPELRTSWQIQLFLENMAQVGARYSEYIRGIWHKDIGDKTLQRPDYIGGSKQPFIVSEVLQTSSSSQTQPLGSMAGHGITAERTHLGKYHCQDWGVIMILMSIRPKPGYMQGLPKQARGDLTRWDFPTPYTMHLSEQIIRTSELLYTGYAPIDDDEFGFQMIWDEYRIMFNQINGMMRNPPFDRWHLARIFNDLPNLNKSFIECDGTSGGSENPLKRIFAVPSEPAFICHSSVRNHSVRPLPFMSTPGQVDH